MTIEQAKNDVLETLSSMDKEKLSLPDLHLYAQILKTVSEIQSKSYAEHLAETLAAVGGGFGMKAPTVSDLK